MHKFGSEFCHLALRSAFCVGVWEFGGVGGFITFLRQSGCALVSSVAEPVLDSDPVLVSPIPPHSDPLSNVTNATRLSSSLPHKKPSGKHPLPPGLQTGLASGKPLYDGAQGTDRYALHARIFDWPDVRLIGALTRAEA